VWTRWLEFQECIEPWRRLGVVKFENGAEAIAPRRNLALDGYMFWTYAALSTSQIEMAQSWIGCRFPAALRDFYRRSNGARVFGVINIDGYVAPGVNPRDLSDPQPVDMRIGNIQRPDGAIVFGAMTGWNGQAKLGVWPNGEVRLINSTDFTDMPKAWADFDTFIFEEMARLTPLHNDEGEFIGQRSDCFPPEARHFEKNDRPD
jgi:hypothetical protein